MIKKIKVTIPAKKEKIIENSISVCDLCGKEYSDSYYLKKCYLCEREICGKCRKDDPDCFGDYPDEYCNICYDLKFNKYKETRLDIESAYDESIEDLKEIIKEESLETKL